MANTLPSTTLPPRDANSTLPDRFLTEEELCKLLGTTRRAFRQRPDSAKPPGRSITPRKRIYACDEVAVWIANLPRT